MPSQSAQCACALTADPLVRDARWPPPSALLALGLLFGRQAEPARTASACALMADRLVRDA